MPNKQKQNYITLNGHTHSIGDATTLRDLCDQLKVGERGFAVEQNGSIIPRSQLAKTLVVEGDTIEIVHMVGGG